MLELARNYIRECNLAARRKEDKKIGAVARVG